MPRRFSDRLRVADDPADTAANVLRGVRLALAAMLS